MIEKSLKENTKIVITKEGINPNIIIGDLPVTSKGDKHSAGTASHV